MRESTVFTIAGVTLISGLLAYAVYFDYKRRNDVEFRKKLRKDKKRVDKTVAQTKESQEGENAIAPEELRAALEKVKNEEVPKSAEEKEHYFMSQVSMGENLCVQGPSFHLPAALCFYRALRVYPSPVELIVIYQKTVPEPVFKIVMEMTNLDVQTKVEGYYDYFPPKSMNVSAKLSITTDSSGNKTSRRILVAEKDFAAGEVIYKEQPVVTVLDFDLEGRGIHCSHCFRSIQPGLALKPPSKLPAEYCSKACELQSKAQSHNLLFSLESPLPPEMASVSLPDTTAKRDKAQVAFVAYIKEKKKVVPLLVARFIGRQVAAETQKMLPNPPNLRPSSDLPEADNGDYSLYDHLERLRYLEMNVEAREIGLMRDVLQTALPGLEHFVTDERHAMLLGKMAYNSYGVCFAGGRDDKPSPTGRPEDMEKTRTPYGTSRQVGSGFYSVSSYIAHSCDPSARPSFSSGTAELHLIANRALKTGDEITVAYVDVTQHSNETQKQARERRRQELARGWRFACGCTKCLADGDGTVTPHRDESKLEEIATRVEEKAVFRSAGDVE